MAREFFGRGRERWAEPGLRAPDALAVRGRAAAALHAPSCAARRAGVDVDRAAAGRRCPASFGRLVVPGPGPVPGGADPALRLPALLAGRSDADGPLRRGALPLPRRRRGGAGELPAAVATSCAASTRSTSSSAPRRGSCPTRSSAARSSPTAPRTRCRFVGPGRPGLGRRGGERARGGGGRRLRSRGGRPALAQVPGHPAAASSSPTPTTWRWSASCPPGCSSSSSFAARPDRSAAIRVPDGRRSAAHPGRGRRPRRTAPGRCCRHDHPGASAAVHPGVLLRERPGGAHGRRLPASTAGIVDSTGMLEIILFLEGEYGIHVEDHETIPENLETISRIAAFVARKRAAAAGEASAGGCIPAPAGSSRVSDWSGRRGSNPRHAAWKAGMAMRNSAVLTCPSETCPVIVSSQEASRRLLVGSP